MRRNKSCRGQFVRGSTIRMDRILEAYRQYQIRHARKQMSQETTSHNYVENYFESRKVYAKTPRSERQRMKSHEKDVHEVLPFDRRVREVKTAMGNRQKTHDFKSATKDVGEEMNLFVSQGRRKTIYDKFKEKELQSRESRLTRVKSAKTYATSQKVSGIKGITFKNPEIAHQTIQVEKDPAISKVIIKRLGKYGSNQDEQTQGKKKNKQKIIIYEKGVLLRNNF